MVWPEAAIASTYQVWRSCTVTAAVCGVTPIAMAVIVAVPLPTAVLLPVESTLPTPLRAGAPPRPPAAARPPPTPAPRGGIAGGLARRGGDGYDAARRECEPPRPEPQRCRRRAAAA